MTLLDDLYKKEIWEDFFNEKVNRNQLNYYQEKQLASFINEERYLNIDINNLSYPKKIIISKMETVKKRIVYSFNNDENHMLSLLAHLLYKYDDLLSDRCYSFRTNKSAKTAFDDIKKIKHLNDKYVLKIDIHNYFNSIDVDILLEMLDGLIDDKPLLSFMHYLLKQDKCYYNEKLIEENRGAMAGVPLANFFANIYLLDLDNYFKENKIEYFRYSDDIIIFFDNLEDLNKYHEVLKEKIKEKHLTFNEDKLLIRNPKEEWEFLGFKYHDGVIDLSDGAIKKLKAKISRKARSLYRWRNRKKVDYDRAATVMIKTFDNKLYNLSDRNDFTWTRFYFPVLTSDKGLKIIDEYMLEHLRYLYSGRHYKGNYKITYESLKQLGYTPLVAEYYNYKKELKLLKKNKEKDSKI